jgi:hypothetical protein
MFGLRGGRADADIVLGPTDTLMPAAKYDESEFLVGGKGSGPGEVDKEWFRLHEGYIYEAQKHVDSGRFPYRYRSDYWRHAAVRHVHWINGLEGVETEDSVIHQLNQMEDTDAREQYQLRFMKHIDRIGATVAEILEVPGGKIEVSRYLSKLRRSIRKMKPGFYTSLYEKMFNDRFSVYEKAGLVLLSASDDEEDDSGALELPDELMQIVMRDGEE